MTNSKNTRRALLISVLTMTLSFVMLIGTTFAWFTDSVSSGKNKIVAGNLDIEVTHTNNNVENEELKDAKLFPVELWEPGVVSYETFTVKNAGSLAFDYTFSLNVSDFNTIEGTEKSLKDVIKLGILEGSVGEMTREELVAAVKEVEAKEGSIAKNFTSFSDFGFEDSMEEANTEKTFTMVAYWEPTENDNDYNVNGGKTVNKLNGDKNELYIEIVVNVVAKQKAYEKDSFNSDYDKKATYPIIADVHYEASTATEFLNALSNIQDGKTTAIHLKEDIELTEASNPDDYWKYHHKITGDKDAIVDLGGKEITFTTNNDYTFTGGILADKVGITVVNGTVNVESGTGFYTTGTATSTFENVTFNVTTGYGVQGVGYTEFTNCNFNVIGNGSGYGIFCSKSTTVKACSFTINAFNGNGIYMNNHCNGNVISDCKFEVSEGNAIYVNSNSDVEISNVDIKLTGNKSVTGIYVSSDSNASGHSVVKLGENILIQCDSTYNSPKLISGAYEFVNITYADGFTAETDGQEYHATAGFTPRSSIVKGSYWKTVSTIKNDESGN